MTRQFKSAVAFKASLDEHLRAASKARNAPLQTFQLKFTMERLLARLFHKPDPPWLLKGGFAMDLRFRPKARTTKDVDLSIGSVSSDGKQVNATIREMLQEAADIDLGDYFAYRIGESKKELTNAPAGGSRFSCETVLLGKVYSTFHIDVGCGDAIVGQPEQLIGDDLLKFADIEPAKVLAITKEQQFAEKIHAYTFTWVGRTNSRTKDLVDLLLLIERGSPVPGEIRSGLKATFATRNTHPIPQSLAPPPEAWKKDFISMAEEAGISTMDYLVGFAKIETYWEKERLSG